jgi:mannose-6-phosphate isomerase-like protein (cupin superfamily)
MITGKVWGSTRLLLETPTFAIHELSILPCAYCSMHVHRHKFNGFYVISGRLRIEVLKSEYALTDITELGPGDFTTVKPGEDHRFLSGPEPVLALEFYYTPALSEDITRRDHGGRTAAV